MSVVSLTSLLVKETKDSIYSFALGVATALGVPVSTWQAGDPTRSLFHVEAEKLSTLEIVVANFIAAGFLDYATGIWLTILAKQVFNVDVPAATYATTTITLTNTGGYVYELNAGDITVKSSLSGKTFHSTTGGHLGALGTLSITVVADEAGSASSAGGGEIDTMVTQVLLVTCSNPTAAVGIDQQSEDTTRSQCRAKLDALSPNGPRGAYSYVARNPTLALTNAVTRVRVYDSSSTGIVTMYLAGPSGGVAEPDRAAVAAACALWATPCCITLITLAAGNVVIPVTYQLWAYKSINLTAAQIQALALTALQQMVATRAIGGDIIPPATTGALYASMIESTIRGIDPKVFRVVVTLPAGDIALTNDQVAVLGTVTPTVTLVNDP